MVNLKNWRQFGNSLQKGQGKLDSEGNPLCSRVSKWLLSHIGGVGDVDSVFSSLSLSPGHFVLTREAAALMVRRFVNDA